MHSAAREFTATAGSRRDADGFLQEARTVAREAAAPMKFLAECLAELRNAVLCLPANPTFDDRAALRHRPLHLETTLTSARGCLDDVSIVLLEANDRAR